MRHRQCGCDRQGARIDDPQTRQASRNEQAIDPLGIVQTTPIQLEAAAFLVRKKSLLRHNALV